MNNTGWYILGFILIAITIAIAAIAFDIWLDIVRRRSRYKARFADGRGYSDRARTGAGRLRGRAWIILICTLIGAITLFAIGENTVRILQATHLRHD